MKALFQTNKKLILILISGIIPNLIIAQDTYTVYLPIQSSEEIKLENREFYIEKVIDSRKDKTKIGTVIQGLNGKTKPADFSASFELVISTYYKKVIPLNKKQLPVSIVINEFEISESIEDSLNIAKAKISAAIYFRENKLSDTIIVSLFKSKEDVTIHHGENICDALSQIVKQFHQTEWKSKITPAEFLAYLNSPSNPDYKEDSINRNVVVLGYQVGGYSLIGFDLEVRLTDYIGVHLGLGYKGYTGGIKIHINERKTSPFFNLSYKDGGFGMLTGAALEFGGIIRFSKTNDFGFYLQGGILRIFEISYYMSQLFESDEFSLSIGAGFSF